MVTEKQWGRYLAKLNNEYFCVGSQDIDYSSVNCPLAFSAACGLLNA